MIAEHLQAAGDLHAAFGWHMRAGAWAATRDIVAAWASWERARQVADALPADDAGRTAMRIAARAWLCGNAFRVYADISGGLFEELRELCTAAGDKPSLAIGMAGLMMEHNRHGRVREASRLASETMALVESIGKPTLTVGLSLAAIGIKSQTGEMAEALRWSQTVIDLADGDPTKGNVVFGSPLAVALASRGTARWALGRAGWRDDFDRALAMARGADPMSHAVVNMYAYGSRDSGRGAAGRRRCAARHRGGAARSPSDRVRISRWAVPGGRWVWRWCIGTPGRSVSADWRCWGRSATCACRGGSTSTCLRPWTCTPRGSGPGAATATVPYR